VSSGWTGRPIPGGRIDPPQSGHYSLRTTRSFLRSKGDRIYLIPTDFDEEFFDMLYLISPAAGYAALKSQWDANPVDVLIDPAISGTPLEPRITRALSAINRLLEVVDSPLRLQASTSPTSLITMSIDPALTRPLSAAYGSRSLRRFGGEITFAESSTATDVELYRMLFFFVSAGQINSPGRSFKSSSGMTTDAPTDLDMATLRIHMNRCAGSIVEDDRGFSARTRAGHETELSQPTCLTPPNR
jgi:hypothetical protein